MITNLLFDFSRVLLHAKDPNYKGGINELNWELTEKNPDYNFFNYFVINDELLNYLNDIKYKFSINMLTTYDIQNRPEVRQNIDTVFNKIFSATELGLKKTDPHTYIDICEKLHAEPKEVLFIDDTIKNIEAAEKTGLDTIHYTTNELLISRMKNLTD